jgi:hypothetical protein
MLLGDANVYSSSSTVFSPQDLIVADMSDHRSSEAVKGQYQHDEKMIEDQLVAVDSFGSHAKVDPAEIKLVRKLDWFILPTLWLMYWFNYLDRNAITVARLDSMEEELNLSSVEYQTCVSILFVGYILGQLPSSTLPS